MLAFVTREESLGLRCVTSSKGLPFRPRAFYLGKRGVRANLIKSLHRGNVRKLHSRDIVHGMPTKRRDRNVWMKEKSVHIVPSS